jgi:hypothetical protein
MADYNSAYTGQEIDAGIAKANAAVPGSRTVNGKALSADVTLSAADVGARADNWTPDAAEVGADPAGTAETKANAVQTNLTSHTNNKSNPHGVTAAQVGAVPTSRTVNGKALSANISLTKADVGLGNVDNTSDTNKPISTATQTALNGKANTSHTHAAGDITSGTLAVARGGTGQTTLTPAVTTKGVRQIYAGTADMTAGTTALTTGCVYLVYE